MRGLRIAFLLTIVATFVVFQNASEDPDLDDSQVSQNSTGQPVVDEEESLEAVNGSQIYYRELQEIQALNNSQNYSIEYRHKHRVVGAKKTYKLGKTALSELSDDDLNAMLGNQPPSAQLYQANVAPKRYRAGTSQPLPKAFDWRKKGAVTEVKHQGRCSSCWCFATAGALEAQTKIKKGKLVPLSVKQLVDCAGGGNVCGKGGNVFNALQYVMANGLQSEEDYPPYKPQQSACKFDSDSSNIALQYEQRDRPGMYLPPGNIGEIKNALVNYGPLIVSLHVDAKTWKGYKEGVFLEPTCNNDRWKVNHSVLLVGYNRTTINGRVLPYWIIKNSWGKGWGIGGYMHIASGQQQCAIEEWVLQPTTQ